MVDKTETAQSKRMKIPAERPGRPMVVTVIGLIQVFLGAYLLLFVGLAWANPDGNLDLLHRSLYFLAGDISKHPSETYQPHGEYRQHGDLIIDMLFTSVPTACMGVYCLVTAFGLWRLKPWARHSVAGEYGIVTIYSLRSFFMFGMLGGFSRVRESVLQPVYGRLMVAGMISLTLMFHGGVAEAFGEQE